MENKETIMRKRLFIGLKIVIGLVLFFIVLQVGMNNKFHIPAYGGGQGNGSSSGRIEVGMEEETALVEEEAGTTVPTVYITRQGFKPKVAQIKVGDKIIFINKTGRNSQLYTKSDRLELIREVTLDGDERAITFPRIGQIDIVDVFNKDIKLRVYVQK